MTKKISTIAIALSAFAMACADAPTVNRLLPSTQSLVIVGDAVANNVELEILKVCKVWVNAPDADIDVTVSGSTSHDGTYTVPTATGTPPNTCRAVAIEGGTAGGGAGLNITVTEDDPGAGFTTTWTVDNSNNALDAAGAGLSAATLIGGASINGAVITFTNTFTPTTGNEGCTPGYWKQPQHLDSWTGYAPGDDFDATFGVNLFNPDITLLTALGLNGGGVNALARHAVAALLNAAQGFYPMTEAEVIAAVQAAAANPALIESTKNTLAGNNELGCPLD